MQDLLYSYILHLFLFLVENFFLFLLQMRIVGETGTLWVSIHGWEGMVSLHGGVEVGAGEGEEGTNSVDKIIFGVENRQAWG